METQNKKTLGLVIGVIVLAALLWGANYYNQHLRGLLPAIIPAGQDITKAINSTDMPLQLPPGFSIQIFAKNLPDARVIIQDSHGNFWVSQTDKGTVSLLTVQNGVVASQKVIFSGLTDPHGLAIDPTNPNTLYIAELTKISTAQIYSSDDSLIASPTLKKIADLPDGGRHFTRTLGFGPDGRLYVSIGSTCDSCTEADPRNAAIYSMNKDGSDFKSYATGLRNSIFFTWGTTGAETGKLYATDMGRDGLGNNLPPDEINVITQGSNYGWPSCYGDNVQDRTFNNTTASNPCTLPTTQPSFVDLQAHSAAMGIVFAPKNWPAQYQNSLIVAYHGSTQSTALTGYKLVQVQLDSKGNYVKTSDFITGWLQGSDVLGRPVDILVTPDNSMYVTDDKAGVVYKITYDPNAAASTAAAPTATATLPAPTPPATGSGFVTEKGNADIIKLDAPIKAGYPLISPITITGEARGSWYYEGVFGIKLLDGNGNLLSIDTAEAQGQWTTTDYVPFSAQLTFPQPKTPNGTLELIKDNPSGNAANDDMLSLPVTF